MAPPAPRSPLPHAPPWTGSCLWARFGGSRELVGSCWRPPAGQLPPAGAAADLGVHEFHIVQHTPRHRWVLHPGSGARTAGGWDRGRSRNLPREREKGKPQLSARALALASQPPAAAAASRRR